jgi:hypothetical protein
MDLVLFSDGRRSWGERSNILTVAGFDRRHILDPKCQHHHPNSTAGIPTIARTTVTVKKAPITPKMMPRSFRCLPGPSNCCFVA